jgi:hypothetical protein
MNMENIWSEIRSGFEDEGVLYIDAWVSPDDNEEGKVIATINLETGRVSYRDDRAKTDAYAQEVISLALQTIASSKETGDDICTDGLFIGELPYLAPDQGIPEETHAPENFSMCELEDFIDEHGKFLDEIQVVTGYDLDGYFYEPGSTKWILTISPDYSERDQAISNYLQAHKHFPKSL